MRPDRVINFGHFSIRDVKAKFHFKILRKLRGNSTLGINFNRVWPELESQLRDAPSFSTALCRALGRPRSQKS